MSVALSHLFEQAIIGPDIDVSGLALDSRKVQPNDVFLAYRGHAQNGHDYIAQAIEKGAAAVAVQEPQYVGQHQASYVVVEDLPMQLGNIAARFYQNPSQQLNVVGVTGTNGKTSISHYIRQLLQLVGKPCAVIGTVGSYIGDKKLATNNTTPDALYLQQLFAECVEAGVDYVAMEVSSHALVQNRCQATHFKGAVFSNLSQDHLDYHKDLQDYFAAKKQLFAWPNLAWAVVNIDDDYGAALHREIAAQLKVLSYSTRNQQADIYLDDIQYRAGCYHAQLWVKGKQYPLVSQLQGEFNLQNLLAALASVYALGVDIESVVAQLANVVAVAGRMQLVKNALQISAIVDFAHTPDALDNVLSNLKPLTTKRLIVVFGCGGDRDQAKRPLMAQAVERYADVIVVTSDNPRSEQPEKIIAEIAQGFASAAYYVISDRKQAIDFAVEQAQAGDIILVAGKGHEQYQIIGEVKHPFDDVAVLTSALKRKGAIC